MSSGPTAWGCLGLLILTGLLVAMAWFNALSRFPV
jgi:hypothetical protein